MDCIRLTNRPPAYPLLQPIIPRAEWGALPPKEVQYLQDCPILQVGFFATGHPKCKNKEECIQVLQKLQKTHMEELDMPDIACNFYICADNLVFEGRGWYTRSDKVDPNHVYWDGKSIDIGYIGVFNYEEPPLSVYETRDDLVNDGIILMYIDRRASYIN